VLAYLQNSLQQSDDDLNRWARHWIDLGLSALDQVVAGGSRRGKFCFGDTPTLADICLVPQLANARRFGCNLSVYPTLLQIETVCNALQAFADAAPEKQPDAE
jgi:maleylpyruvate isomerase